MKKSFAKSPFVFLLIAHVLLGCLYSVVTPIFEASDEIWHYPMVKYLADHALALPVQDPNVSTAWRQEGSQPPLYYLLGAALTFWIDTSDLDKVRTVNPHADIGAVVPDGNVNMIVHDPAVESFPWRGTALAVHIVRFLSVALGAVTVAMTYLLALELFPGKGWLALAAAAFTAFNPMFLFISGSVNNDNLSNALASVLLVLIARLLKRATAPSIRELALIGVIAGAGMLAKFQIGFLLPLIALALALLAYRLRDWRPLVAGGAISGGLTILIAGWWYIRNAQLYGDVTGLNMFIRIVGPRTIPANLPQLWSERHTFLMSYWGFFGGVNVPLPDFVYTIFNGIAALAAVGLVIGLARSAWRMGVRTRTVVSLRNRFTGLGWPILLGRAVSVIWIVVLFVSLLRWTSATWASQGRLMFGAIAPLSLWMAVGLWAGERSRASFAVFTALILTWFILIACFVAPTLIAQTYHNALVPTPIPAQKDALAWFYEPGDAEPSIEMFTYAKPLIPELSYPRVHVGEYYWFCRPFRFLRKEHFTRDWSVFIHLEQNDGLIVAQRDVYLGQGKLATSLINVNDNQEYPPGGWQNCFAVRIPDTAYAPVPQLLTIYLGFYDLQTGQRMLTSGVDATTDDRAVVGFARLLPRDSSLNVPNPMSVNFGGEAELVGYDVSSLVMVPGQKVTITLYWRALHPMTTDYRVFTQIVEPNTTRVFGNGDSMPAMWTRPTSTWKPGEIVKDEHTFTINADTPPGTWQIVAGMYQPTAAGGFRRLRVITPDGGEASDFVNLSRVKVIPPPEEF